MQAHTLSTIDSRCLHRCRRYLWCRVLPAYNNFIEFTFAHRCVILIVICWRLSARSGLCWGVVGVGVDRGGSGGGMGYGEDRWRGGSGWLGGGVYGAAAWNSSRRKWRLHQAGLTQSRPPDRQTDSHSAQTHIHTYSQNVYTHTCRYPWVLYALRGEFRGHLTDSEHHESFNRICHQRRRKWERWFIFVFTPVLTWPHALLCPPTFVFTDECWRKGFCEANLLPSLPLPLPLLSPPLPPLPLPLTYLS